MSDLLPLLAVPNVSEGRDGSTLDAIAAAVTKAGATTLLDRHSDVDHHRSVLTFTGHPGALAPPLLLGAQAAVERIDVMGDAGAMDRLDAARRPDGDPTGAPQPRGVHPYVGALDVMPIVYLDSAMRGAACAEALILADAIGAELAVPVLLYGDLADGRTRAELRRGGPSGLRARMASGEQRPDFGPPTLHPTAGATLVTAREPLVAFNLELASPATVRDARRIAALIREGGEEGLPGLRAIGVGLDGGSVAQVSMNVERPLELPLRSVVAAVRRHADLAAAELVGLAPQAAFDDFPADLPMPAFDPERQVIEKALGL
jgi:glutamate formiminotransferase / 5-formyltetrahydrofolate cyclo-ligase